MQTGEFDFYFTENNAGVESGYNDRLKEIVLLAVEYDIIQRRGAWFYLSEEDKFQGLDKLVEYLKTLDLKDMEERIKKIALKGV